MCVPNANLPEVALPRTERRSRIVELERLAWDDSSRVPHTVLRQLPLSPRHPYFISALNHGALIGQYLPTQAWNERADSERTLERVHAQIDYRQCRIFCFGGRRRQSKST